METNTIERWKKSYHCQKTKKYNLQDFYPYSAGSWESLMNIIDVNNLTKFYGKSRGVENLSFTVNEGEIFGFIGPNGAGKSTTIRLLLSLIHPTRGQIADVLANFGTNFGHVFSRTSAICPLKSSTTMICVFATCWIIQPVSILGITANESPTWST